MNKEKYTQYLPDFTPYKILKIGSNTISVKYLVNISGFVPLIIGTGEIPQIWMSVKINDTIIPLIEGNIPRTPQVKSYLSNNEIEFSVFNFKTKEWDKLIHIKLENKDEPYIDVLNLRPIGLNIFLDGNSLQLGGLTLTNTTINNSGTGALIGTE